MSNARLPNAKSSYWAPSIRIYAIYFVHFKRRYARSNGNWLLSILYVCMSMWYVHACDEFSISWQCEISIQNPCTLFFSVILPFSTLNFACCPSFLSFSCSGSFFFSFLFRIIYFMWWNTWTVVIWCFTFKFRDALPNIKQNSLAPKSYRDWNFYIRWESFIGMCIAMT